MRLYEQLLAAKSEEDVKDAYIKALGLKGYSKNLIDIRLSYMHTILKYKYFGKKYKI